MDLKKKTDLNCPPQWMSRKDKMTQTIRICFVIETTFKMTSYLRDVQAHMDEVVDDICFRNSLSNVQVGAVYYRDYNDSDRIGFTDFMSPNDFFNLPLDLESESKTWYWSENDTADVALGLKTVNSLNWDDADIKLIFHYGVSPAHGRQFYGPDVSDMFPEGCPSKHNLLELVHQFSEERFNYTFMRITAVVDTMLSLFHEVYTGPGKFEVYDLDITESYTSEPDSEEE